MARVSPRFISLLFAPATALLVTSGCSEDADANGPEAEKLPVSALDLDPCETLQSDTLTQIGLTTDNATDTSEPGEPACEWRNYEPVETTPHILIWVVEPVDGSEARETKTISGADVHVWVVNWDGDGGRYIVPCGNHDLDILYHQNKGSLDATSALDLLAADAIDAYGCAA